jgi:hypothetical protein
MPQVAAVVTTRTKHAARSAPVRQSPADNPTTSDECCVPAGTVEYGDRPMQRSERGDERQRYEARLLDGPWAGARVYVKSRPGGDPLDILPIDGERRGAYVLAGVVTTRGCLPYRWVTPEEWTGLGRWLRFGRAGREAR